MSLLGLAGNSLIIIGVMTVIESKQNPFSDFILFVMLLINQIIIYLIEMFSIWLRRVCGVWETRTKQGVESPDGSKLEKSRLALKEREADNGEKPDNSLASDKVSEDLDRDAGDDREEAKDDLSARLPWSFGGASKDIEHNAKASG